MHLPDSTGDQLQISPQCEGSKVQFQSIGDKPHSLSQPPGILRDQSKTNARNDICSLEREQQVDQNQARMEDSNEVLCAVCQSGGELLCCDKCHKVFHLTCHVPTLLKSPWQVSPHEIYLLLVSDENSKRCAIFHFYVYIRIKELWFSTEWKKRPSIVKNEAVAFTFWRCKVFIWQQHYALAMCIPAYWLLHWVSGLSLFSGEWFCSFCCDLLVPEMEHDCDRKLEAKTVKTEPDSEGGFPLEDKRVSAFFKL